MSWLLITIAASVVLGTSAVFDKMLLRRPYYNPWAYAFWIGVLSILSIVLIPFGFASLPFKLIFFAVFTGAVFLAAIFFFVWALREGEVSTALPVIGGLAPIFTLVVSSVLLKSNLGISYFAGFLFLVGGGIILLGIEEKEIRWKVFWLSLVSAALFGFSNVMKKMVFDQSPFITGFIWMNIGGVALALAAFLWPGIKKKIFVSVSESNAANKLLYLANRAWSAVGSFLIYLAIAQGHPALVDAGQGLKYVIIIFAAWFLLRERFFGKILFWKLLATALIIFGLLWLGAVEYGRSLPVIDQNRPIVWGITFSSKFSRELGLDWQKNFEAVLNDLQPKKLRLVAHWDEIEKEKGVFDFSEMDWLLDRSTAAGTKVVFVLGMRVPRWPECHIPEWAKNLSVEDRETALRDYIGKVIERYKDNKAIEMWQVENEPYLWFGECPERGEDFVQKEIKLVKSIDSSRPVLVTDSGEFGLWYKAVLLGDVFGTTMYRRVNSRFFSPIFGEAIEYPIGPDFFRLKERVVRFLTRDYRKRFIVVELQAEPWSVKLLSEIPLEKQIDLFSPEYFKETIDYAKRTGFDEYYLWGAEWWWWLGINHGNWNYWNEVKKLLNNN